MTGSAATRVALSLVSDGSEPGPAPADVRPPQDGTVAPRAPSSFILTAGRGADRVIGFLVLPALTFAAVLIAYSAIQQHVAHDLPALEAIWARARVMFADPFYVNGPNDQGIVWQVLYSLERVLAGFAIATIIGLPAGFLIGSSRVFETAWTPLIQILRPVSPLAWLPVGLLLFKAVNPSAIFVIFITSIWPIVLNTAAGVKAIPQDYLNVARVLSFNRVEMMRKIYLPATLPYVLTGMQLSLGTAWMVIVAAEMLTGGAGIGFFIWDEWNNLDMPSIFVAIFVIGAVGIALDGVMYQIRRHFDYAA